MNSDLHRFEKGAVDALTERIIGSAYKVHNTLGPGFLEKVYENALVHELSKVGLSVEQQQRYQVMYDGVCVGEYVADIVVDHAVLVELKVARTIDNGHIAQCLNSLAVTQLPIGLVLNFSRSVDVKRLLRSSSP